MGLGDEVIVTGQVRELQALDPRRVRVAYEKKIRWFDIWDHNPRLARPEEDGDFQVFKPRTDYLRPYCVAKTPHKWTWKTWKPPRGEIYLTADEDAFGQAHGGMAILQPAIKGAAPPNKQWGEQRWRTLAAALVRMGMKVGVIGQDIRVNWPGVRNIPTASIRSAAAVLAHCSVCVVPEGALHHIAAAAGAPAVVIYGGYISPAVTGYDGQIPFFTGTGLGCGNRQGCLCCDHAMSKILPADVAEAAKRVAR